MKKVSEAFKSWFLPLTVQNGRILTKDYRTVAVCEGDNIVFIIAPSAIKPLESLTEILNTYDQLKEERDEAVELLGEIEERLRGKVNSDGTFSTVANMFGRIKLFNDRVRKNSTTVSGDDTDKEK